MKKQYEYLFLIGLIIIFIATCLIIDKLPKSNASENFHTRAFKEGKTEIAYPEFSSIDINKQIKRYLTSKNYDNVKEVTYKVYKVDNYISIIFTNTYEDETTKKHSITFDNKANIISLDKLITNNDLFMNRLQYKLSNYKLNINIDNLDISNLNYALTTHDLLIYFDEPTYEIIIIEYNLLKDVIKLNYAFEEVPEPTTTTTTTTTTKVYEKTIAFSFDDGPSKYTTRIMDVLDKYGYKATFFEVGYMMKSFPEVTKEVYQRGFEVGNHTTDHSNLNKLKVSDVVKKIEDNNTNYNKLTNDNMILFRPPYGNTNKTNRPYIKYPIIRWSVDTRDWESRNKDKIIETTLKYLKDKDIVLFHDIYPTTLEAVEYLVPYLHDQGYNIVSVSELFKINNIELENSKVYYSAR